MIDKLLNLYNQDSLKAIKNIIIGNNALNSIDKIINNYSGPITVLTDVNIANSYAFEKLKNYSINQIILNNPICDIETCEYLAKQLNCDLLISLGSGTLNDISKFISHKLNIPFISIASAASMNGYVSKTSSIKFNKLSKSIETTHPDYLIMDLDIINESPIFLTKSGFGDMICNSTCEVDSFLSNKVMGTEHNQLFFDIIRKYVDKLIKNSVNIKTIEYKKTLCESLIISGLTMLINGDSRPASQGEHILSHYYNSCYNANNFHGEEIGVLTYYMSLIQKKLIRRNPSINSHNIDFFKKTYPNEELIRSYITLIESNLIELNKSIKENWQEITQFAKNKIVNPKEIKKSLEQAGCKSNLNEINFEKDKFKDIILTAKFTRDRFTFLNLI